MKLNDESLEDACRLIYGQTWDGPPEKMPGEKMKEIWRKEVRKYEAAILAARPRPDVAALAQVIYDADNGIDGDTIAEVIGDYTHLNASGAEGMRTEVKRVCEHLAQQIIDHQEGLT